MATWTVVTVELILRDSFVSSWLVKFFFYASIVSVFLLV